MGLLHRKPNGAGKGTRTPTLLHRNLNPARLPIPSYRHIKKCGWSLSGGAFLKRQHSSH